MAEFKNPFQNVRIVYRRSKPLMKVAVIAVIVLSMAALLTLRWTLRDIQGQIQDMRSEASRLEAENAELDKKIDELGSVQSVMDIAQEELGLVDPNTVVVVTD